MSMRMCVSEQPVGAWGCGCMCVCVAEERDLSGHGVIAVCWVSVFKSSDQERMCL